MCASLKTALDNSRTFNSMSDEDKTAAENQRKQERSKGNGKPQGKNPNTRQQNFSKGGTIAADPASNNRRNNGRANTASADDDVVSSEED